MRELSELRGPLTQFHIGGQITLTSIAIQPRNKQASPIWLLCPPSSRPTSLSLVPLVRLRGGGGSGCMQRLEGGTEVHMTCAV